MTKTILTNARVFDGDRVGEPTTVVIDGAVLGSDASDGDTLDCAGATLLPGLIDAHVHLLTPEDLQALAGYGITTALDMACWPRERVDSFRGTVPDIRSAGLPAIGPGGNHSRLPGMPTEAILTAAEQAAPFVAERVAEGSDYIKVVIEGDLLDQPTIDAVVAEGKKHGKLTVAHASTVDAYRRAVFAGADIVTHVPTDGVLDAEILAAMLNQAQIAVPTLTMMEASSGLRPEGQGYSFSRDSVTALHEAGVPIVAGTDAFSAPFLPEPVRHGRSLHRELALLVEAGLSAAESLRSATSEAARCFGLTDRGEVRPGFRADLVLVDGDPTQDIAATTRLRRIWAGGVEQEPVS